MTSRPRTPATVTQSKYPWRTTARTVFQAACGLAVLTPAIVDASGVDAKAPWVAASLAVSGGVAKVMAIPGVNAWLERFVPFLAAEPKPKP